MWANEVGMIKRGLGSYEAAPGDRLSAIRRPSVPDAAFPGRLPLMVTGIRYTLLAPKSLLSFLFSRPGAPNPTGVSCSKQDRGGEA
jgi:hypothetical protein